LLHRVPQGFGRNGASVGAGPPNLWTHFDNRGFLVMFGCVERSRLARRAASNDNKIELVLRHDQ